MKEEYAKYVQQEKERLRKEPKSSKGLWSKTRRLLKQTNKVCSIPGLKRPDGTWCRESAEKANHLADTFKAKFTLAQNLKNEYTEIEERHCKKQGGALVITDKSAERYLRNLRIDSATGPDELPARVISNCCEELKGPFKILAKLRGCDSSFR